MAKTISERLEQARSIRDAILDRMEGRANENHNSYSIADRSITKMTLDELATAYEMQNKIVRTLTKEFGRANGVSSKVRARF